MASGGPMMNGDITRSPNGMGTLEETVQQMNVLIQENIDLKEAIRKTNIMMKERFEGLSAWREKHQEERNQLVSKLDEAQVQMEAMTLQNQELSKKLEEAGMLTDILDSSQVASHSVEVNTLRAQLARLQAEKNDLVALNSELQLKADQNSHEDSFIEIIKVSDDNVVSKHPDMGMTASRLDSEEVTVSHLLQSLRNETQRAERLQGELHATFDKIKKLEERKSNVNVTTQTSMAADTREDCGKAPSELETIKSQMRTLFNELQQAQSKLDEAEGMKKNLQDRCREGEQDVVTLKAQLVDKQAVQTENDRLKLQLDSMQAQSLIEQRKGVEERSNLAQLKDAYTQLFEDYNELKEEKKRSESQLVSREVVDELQGQLTAAEKALANKQENIDQLKKEIFQKEKELETICVLQAQAEVYSSDFYAERAAREKLHEERERLAVQLEYVKKQNSHLQEEMESMSRQTMLEMQKRHVANQHGRGAALVGRGTDWQHQGSIPEHVCPKCNDILPDLDSLQIHIMDCIN
uniref:optineurin n=1 Tax=Doryrhamphus excisus TaxID=161450 RepID=UPI0025AEC769|nr:optineurin [Doryrhamphus excisus]